jgi:hypothetical protein
MSDKLADKLAEVRLIAGPLSYTIPSRNDKRLAINIEGRMGLKHIDAITMASGT